MTTIEGNAAPEIQTPPSAGIYMATHEFWLSFLVILFGMAALWFQFILLKGKRIEPDKVVRVFGVTVIVIGVIFAVTAGYGTSQLAPTTGLLGTLAGYLLGRGPEPTKRTTTARAPRQRAREPRPSRGAR